MKDDEILKPCEAITLIYKGVSGTLEFSKEDNVYFGRLYTENLVSYEGKTKDLLLKAFFDAVDDFLNDKEN